MAFRFSIAAVLRVKESVEKREERVLQQIQLEIARLARRVDELNSELTRMGEARDQVLKCSVSASNLHMLQRTAYALREQKIALLKDMDTLAQKRDHQMQVYQAAHRDRETLTDMRVKQREAHELVLERREQKNLDDIFSSRRSR